MNFCGPSGEHPGHYSDECIVAAGQPTSSVKSSISAGAKAAAVTALAAFAPARRRVHELEPVDQRRGVGRPETLGADCSWRHLLLAGAE